jgi:hypothetical protein
MTNPILSTFSIIQPFDIPIVLAPFCLHSILRHLTTIEVGFGSHNKLTAFASLLWGHSEQNDNNNEVRSTDDCSVAGVNGVRELAYYWRWWYVRSRGVGTIQSRYLLRQCVRPGKRTKRQPQWQQRVASSNVSARIRVRQLRAIVHRGACKRLATATGRLE